MVNYVFKKFVQFSVLIIVLIGYYEGRYQKLTHGMEEHISKLVFKYTLPILIFVSFATTKESLIVEHLILILVAIIVLLIPFFIAFLFMRLKGGSEGECGMYGFLSSQSNVIYFGIPVVAYLFGGKGMLAIILIILAITVTVIPLAIYFCERELNKDALLRDILLKVGKGEIIIATVIGLVWTFLNVPLPVSIERAFHMFGDLTSAIALFATGMTIAKFKPKLDFTVSFSLVLKLILQPLLAFVFAYLFGMPTIYMIILVLCFACPPPTNAVILSQNYGIYKEGTSGVLFWGIIFYFITFSCIYLFLSSQFKI